MRVIDISGHPYVDATFELQRELSRARSADESIQSMMSRLGSIAAVKYIANVRTKGLPEGQFRLLERGSIEQRARTRSEQRTLRPYRADWERFPVLTGGIISRLIVPPTAKVVHHLDVHDDPVLGNDIAHLGSVLVTPVFEDGEVAEWILAFHEGEEEVTADQLRISIPNANLMARTARQMDLLFQVNDLNNRLKRQLQEVASVQQSLLPRVLPAIPGVKIATSYLTSDEAGGDYYDFLRMPKGRWGILIADVSGHGAAAATVMAMLHAILHGYERPRLEPEAMMSYANKRLCAARLDGTFVTAFLAIYDPATAELVYTRAGHNPPRLKRGTHGHITPIDDGAGPPLGVISDAVYEQASRRLEENDTLVLYTDGITEAFSPDRRMFGVDGLDAALESCTGDPDCVVESVHRALFEHTKSRRRTDDQTLVAMRYVGER